VDTLPSVDRADVRETDDGSTLILSAGGLHVMMIRLRYDSRWGDVDEVINSAGEVATAAVSPVELGGNGSCTSTGAWRSYPAWTPDCSNGPLARLGTTGGRIIQTSTGSSASTVKPCRS
jgi:hypothetical protein